ncbi:MAG: FAD-binding oxidoreductase [Candidatus Omnitrophota bacterium]
MKQFNARVIKVIPRTYNVTSFRFAAEEAPDFQAGQFMQVTLAVNGCEQSKYFSFSSSPTEKGYFEFTKKITRSEFSKALKRLKAGDTLTVKMPMGKFVLDGTTTKHAFLSGGIGITPIRSMLKDAFDRRLPVDMALFYSNHSPEDIVFRTELEEMARDHKNLKIGFSLDAAEACPAGWKGKCGFINADMIKEELPDYAERIFYVCGPPAMVKSLVSILEDQLKVPAGRIRKENFAGY